MSAVEIQARGRLMQVLVARIVSEKATMMAEKQRR